MTVVKLHNPKRDWSERERQVFCDLFNFRILYGRRCTYLAARADSGEPYFTLMVHGTGEIIMHIDRGSRGRGYRISGPTRDEKFAPTLDDLKSFYAEPSEELIAGYSAI
jgi:hypothetical protein